MTHKSKIKQALKLECFTRALINLAPNRESKLGRFIENVYLNHIREYI